MRLMFACAAAVVLGALVILWLTRRPGRSGDAAAADTARAGPAATAGAPDPPAAPAGPS